MYIKYERASWVDDQHENHQHQRLLKWNYCLLLCVVARNLLPVFGMDWSLTSRACIIIGFHTVPNTCSPSCWTQVAFDTSAVYRICMNGQVGELLSAKWLIEQNIYFVLCVVARIFFNQAFFDSWVFCTIFTWHHLCKFVDSSTLITVLESSRKMLGMGLLTWTYLCSETQSWSLRQQWFVMQTVHRGCSVFCHNILVTKDGLMWRFLYELKICWIH